MSGSGAEILDWQARFRSSPSVWAVFYHDRVAGDELCGLYESAEAADVALAWAVRHRGRDAQRYHKREIHIHSMQLATERWR